MKIEKQKTAKFKSHKIYAKRKSIFMVSIFLCFCTQTFFAQTIPSNFFGINYWMPDQFINSGASYPGGFIECPHLQTQVMNAGVTLTRIGGGGPVSGVWKGYDGEATAIGIDYTTNDYIAAIRAVKAVNSSAKFLIQIPIASGGFTFTTANAVTLVNNIKGVYGSDIFYYAIGNEWDKYIKPGTSPARGYYSSEIATIIKSFSQEMKHADPRILIVAPSLSYYGAMDGNTTPQAIMPNLISGTNDITMIISGTGYANIDNIKYYIDVVDFHTYAGGSNGDMSGISGNYSTYRTNSIAYPNNGFATDLSTSSPGLQYQLNRANTVVHTRSGTDALTYAITEVNIDWKNPPLSNPTFPDENQNTVEGLGPRSFFAGQYLADMFSAILKNGTNSSNAKVVFVNPWSVNESSGDGSSFDLSMTKGVMASCSDPAPQALSTYWHYQMVANNFSGTYYANASTASGQTNYKAFACSTATELRVLVMNQNQQSPRGSDNSTNSFKIDFNYTGTNPTGADMLFAFATGVSVTYSGGGTGLTSGVYSCNIQKETTMFLAFDKTTGQLLRNEVYSLQDALRLNDIGPMTYAGDGPESITTQSSYSTYNSTNVWKDINVTPSTGNSISATTNNVFQFTNSFQISGSASATFSSGTTGNTLSIIATGETTCH